MKYIKFFESFPKYKCWESRTFSKHDNNIQSMFDVINVLKKNKITYQVFYHNLDSLIYFRIFVFPNTIEQEHIVSDPLKLRFSPFISSYKIHLSAKNIKDIINNNIYRTKIDNQDINNEYIEMIYQTEKFNL